MSAINVVIPSLANTTLGIGTIIKLIKDCPDNLIRVLHLYRKYEESQSTLHCIFQKS